MKDARQRPAGALSDHHYGSPLARLVLPHQLRKLRRDPYRQPGGLGAPPPRYRARHDWGLKRLPGWRMRLLEMVDLANMPSRKRELEADALALPAARKPPALDHRHLVRHVSVRRIV